MKVIYVIIILSCCALQAAVAYLWTETDAVRFFKETFTSFYEDGVPAWSETAFSLGLWWYSVPVALVSVLAILIYRKAPPGRFLVPALVSIAVFLAMAYAMYPLHLMPKSGQI